MTIYQVYQNDPECPELLFKTADKNKANRFIEQYNLWNTDKETDPFVDKYLYCLQYDTDNMETEADKVISSYSVKKIFEVRYSSSKEEAEVMNICNRFQESVKAFYEQVIASVNDTYFVNLQENVDVNLTPKEVNVTLRIA